METSTEKSTAMFIGNGKAEIHINGVQLEEGSSFNYLGATFFQDGSSTLNIYIIIATATTVELDRIWRRHSITFTIKYAMYKSLLVPIFLDNMKRRIQAFKNKIAQVVIYGIPN